MSGAGGQGLVLVAAAYSPQVEGSPGPGGSQRRLLLFGGGQGYSRVWDPSAEVGRCHSSAEKLTGPRR